jgi:hypothetical protein
MQPILKNEQHRALQTYGAWLTTLNSLMFNALEAIIEIDQLLNQFQPINSGRMRVMWFTLKPNATQYSEEREPLMVQWHYQFKSDHWRAKRVPLNALLRHQITKGGFAQHADSARAALQDLRSLIEIYRRARRMLKLLGISTKEWVPEGRRCIEKYLSKKISFTQHLEAQPIGSRTF